MAHLTNQQKDDIRLSRDIYCNLFDDSDAIVFVHEPKYRNFYVFGSQARRLKLIINIHGFEIVYPKSYIDSEIYYEIPDDDFYSLLAILVCFEEKILIV